MIPSFEERVSAWSNPPFDDIGYLSSADMLKVEDERLKLLVGQAERARYGGWRNHRNKWRTVLKMNSTSGKKVMDYGCGMGIEALQYARNGNDIVVADISRDNIHLALRVLNLYGFLASSFQIIPEQLMPGIFGEFDVVHCAGVLHHIPEPVPVVKAMAEQLVDHGELRLMVYSDRAWDLSVGTDPPEVVHEDPGFEQYWRSWDSVGGYADWYDADRLEQRFGKWFTLEDYALVSEHGEYACALMRKR